jgi:osmotically-inducible protein OsmY
MATVTVAAEFSEVCLFAGLVKLNTDIRRIKMIKKTKRFLLAPGVVLMMAAMSGQAIADDSVSQGITDARQETQIWTTYALNPYLRANDLSVTVRSGKATITGNVDEGVEKDLAQQIALGVTGIKDVENQIKVQPDYVPPTESTSRSYGQIIDDATITAAIKSKLAWNKQTSGLSTEVSSKAGVVTLTGTANNASSKNMAERLAIGTRGVASVNNQIAVNGKPTITESAKATAHEAGVKVEDSWITTKVKSTLLYSSNVNSSGIVVKTNDGIVTLSGKSASGAERALAVELTKNIRGVKGVYSKGLLI